MDSLGSFACSSAPLLLTSLDAPSFRSSQAGARLIWFNQDFPDFPPPTAPGVCRIEVEISQLQVERSRVVSADGFEDLPTPPPQAKPVSNSSSLTSISSTEEEDDEDAFGDTVSQALRILVLGNVDAGKSTIVGALTTQSLDDGRGSCRLQVRRLRRSLNWHVDTRMETMGPNSTTLEVLISRRFSPPRARR